MTEQELTQALKGKGWISRWEPDNNRAEIMVETPSFLSRYMRIVLGDVKALKTPAQLDNIIKYHTESREEETQRGGRA